MRNFTIYTKGEDTHVEIFGDIGESFFGEGNTFDTVKAQLEGVKGRKINVKISSLGGDALEGLAIYDLFKSLKQKVTAEIVGATASAGTIIALGADEVKITENSLFLIHNAWTVAMGNADDLRKTAEGLETVDNRLVNIYEKKTGKSESEIRDLMSQDKWIDANEAKEFGLVDSIIEPIKAAASVVKPIIEADAKYKLPELPQNLINNNSQMEENKDGLMDKLTSFVNAFSSKEAEAEKVSALEAKFTEVEGVVNTVSEENETLKNAINEKESAIEAMKAELAEANEKLAKANASKTEVAPKADEPSDAPVNANPLASFFKNRILNRY